MISRSTVTEFSVTISRSAFAECVWQFHVVAINLFLLSIWCLGRAVDSTRQLSLRFQLWFQGLLRLCFRWRFLVRSVAVSLAIPSVNDDSIFCIDFLHQSWISVRCWFHQSATTQLSKMISFSTVTQFSGTIYGSTFAQCVWQFHVVAINLFLLSIWCVGPVATTFSLTIYCEQWCSFTGDSMRQWWLCFLYWFHASIVN